MTQEKRLDYLLDFLCGEYNENISRPKDYTQKRDLLRRLVNVRPPRPAPDDFILVQDSFLQEEATQRGIVCLTDIPSCQTNGRISLWQGDITRLEVDAIVNAANSQLLGCFAPGHSCIDNVIHTYAGVQLRQVCHELMQKQGHDEPTGTAKITPSYNLPCRYVLHTVGPVVEAKVSEQHELLLSRCYTSCLDIAAENGLKSIAFCCISTGVFRFPGSLAACIAVKAVRAYLGENQSIERVVFDVYTDKDYLIYSEELSNTVIY